MIHRKTRLGIQTELGSKNYLLQNNESGNNGGEKKLAPEGSETAIQTKILIEAVDSFASEGKTTKNELDLLERLDGVLDKLDVVASPDASQFNFAQDTGGTFAMYMGQKTLTTGDPKEGAGQDWILKTAYEEYTKDKKLTKKEIKKIEEIDEVLPNADITINLQTGDATIAHNWGSYNIPFPTGGGKKGK